MSAGRRTVATLVATASAGTLVVLAGQGAAAVTTNDVYFRPPDTVYTVTGHGYGHGIGMSQWGAQGAALRGLSYDRIMAFYYPGTALGWTASGQRVRVRLDRLGTGVAAVTNTATLTYAVAGASLWKPVSSATMPGPSGAPVPVTPANASQVRLVPTAVSGAFDLQARSTATGAWVRTSATALTGPVTWRETSATNPVVQVLSPRRVDYRGDLVETWLSSGSVRHVNRVLLEDYVRGVVPQEAFASWAPEALKSQAVAARSYADHARQNASTSASSDTCDTTACQVYGGRSAELAVTNDAVTATAQRVVTYGGRTALTMFSASNGGWTVSGGTPYLVAQPDPYDGVDPSAYNTHTWTTQLPVSRIQSAWPAIGQFSRVVVGARNGLGELGGRTTSVTVVGTSGSVTVTGNQFRSALGLRSTWWGLSREFFVDVPVGAAFRTEIANLYNQGVTLGWSDGTFRPLESITREQMAAFLYRFAGRPAYTPPARSPFVDVPTSATFYKEISWLASTGISAGWVQPDGSRAFSPTGSVTREQMAAFLYRLAGRPAWTPPAVSPFADVPRTATFYKEVSWLAASGISTGWVAADGTATFHPVQPNLRGEMAAFLTRFSAKVGSPAV